jgi:hypothetical protein
MKTKWVFVFVAFLAAFGLVMIGCNIHGTGQNFGYTPPPAEPPPGGGDPTPPPPPAATFTPHVFTLIEADRKAEITWDSPIVGIIGAAKAGSYFEAVFANAITATDSIGSIATYIASNGYAGNTHLFPALTGETSYEVTLAEVLTDMGLNANELGGVQVQIYGDKETSNKFISVTFFAKD